MAIDERSRHELYLKLEQVLGAQQATTLMEHLPPVGWAHVTTKHDLDQAETRIIARLQADFRSELLEQQRHFVSWMIGLNLTLSGLVFAAAKLI
jgi:hypothetical protein